MASASVAEVKCYRIPLGNTAAVVKVLAVTVKYNLVSQILDADATAEICHCVSFKDNITAT